MLEITRKSKEKKLTVRIGELLRETRTDAGLTQTEVATRMGCTQKDISRWETGRPMEAAKMFQYVEAVGGDVIAFQTKMMAATREIFPGL